MHTKGLRDWCSEVSNDFRPQPPAITISIRCKVIKHTLQLKILVDIMIISGWSMHSFNESIIYQILNIRKFIRGGYWRFWQCHPACQLLTLYRLALLASECKEGSVCW